MNRFLSVFVTLMMVALVFLPTSATAQKVDLKFNPQLNEVLRMQCLVDSTIATNTSGGGMPQPQSQNIKISGLIEIDCQVTKITPENLSTMDVTIKRLAFDLNIPGKPMKMDTKTLGTPTEPAGKVMMALIGQKLTADIDQTGKVTRIAGVDSILDAIIASSGFADDPKSAIFLPMIRSQVSDEILNEQLKGMDSIYPTQAVGVGDSWDVKQMMSGTTGAVSDATYTVKSITPEAVITELTGSFSQDTSQLPSMPNMTQKQSGTMSGNVRFDRKTGMITDMKMTQNVDGTTQMTVPNNNAPMTILTKTAQTFTLKIR